MDKSEIHKLLGKTLSPETKMVAGRQVEMCASYAFDDWWRGATEGEKNEFVHCLVRMASSGDDPQTQAVAYAAISHFEQFLLEGLGKNDK